MKSTIGTAVARLRTHATHAEIARTKLREVARCFEDLAMMSRHNADAATRAAMGRDGPPTPEYTRRATWADRPRLLERAAAMDEIASAIRCELVAGKG
jgi:hypothetical protein